VLAALLPVAAHGAGSGIPVIAAGHYNQFATSDCGGLRGCETTFNTVPSGKTLIVTNVSCTIRASGTSVLTGFVLADAADKASSELMPFLVTTLSGGNRFIQSNDTTSHVFKAGQVPTVATTYSADTSSSLWCSIGGQLK